MTSKRPDFAGDTEARYQDALARRDAIYEAWITDGAPLLSTGSAGQLLEHPLLKMIREHDLLLARLGSEIRRRHRGPEPSAVLKSVGESPATKLRGVK